MKINIAASHRFHLLDLARELADLGHEVKFYSYVPQKRCLKYGLNQKTSKSLFYLLLPFLLIEKITKNSNWSLKLKNQVLDTYLTYFMAPCDIYIALGTVYTASIKAAKKRFNATTILEWGSKHILEQQKILSQKPNFKKQNEYFIKRALLGYAIADFIAIPSDHVRKSFEDRGIAISKLIQNPYGVNLAMFAPTSLSSAHFDLIMVGGWSYRKGCDLLSNMLNVSKLTLLHVGPIVDIDFPKAPNMKHVDSVDQSELKNYYAQAKVFILPSREEGLAMVQAQAIACGLPVVCSKDTGGSDLRELLGDKSWIFVTDNCDIDNLLRQTNAALMQSDRQSASRNYAGDDMEKLTWQSYAIRYNENLQKIIPKSAQIGSKNTSLWNLKNN